MHNLLGNKDQLSNRFTLMRHGNSQANQQGIVVSNPSTGVMDYGLTELGIEQVTGSIKENNTLNKHTLIISSDFKRARETAELVHQYFDCIQPLKLEPRLRERFFGNYDGGEDSCYPIVWEQDRIDSDNLMNNIESPNQVMRRATELVIELDQKYDNKNILLVAHGDILQILLAAFAGMSAGQHRSIEHIETAQIRPT